MLLLICTHCGDAQKLITQWRQCECGKASGCLTHTVPSCLEYEKRGGAVILAISDEKIESISRLGQRKENKNSIFI